MPASLVSAVFTGVSPVDGATPVSYPAAVVSSPNQTSILVLTVPGVGPGLSICVTVAGQTGCSIGAVAAYAPPAVSGNRRTARVLRPCDVKLLRCASHLLHLPPPQVLAVSGAPTVGVSGAGGDLLTITCAGLGPLTVAGATYFPVVSYAGPTGRALTATCSARVSATAQTTIQCRTAQGAGGPYALAVCVGLTGQCGAPSSIAAANITYAPPQLSAGGYRGPTRLLTSGGESIVVAGTGLGTAAQVAAGLYSVSLAYGPLPSASAFAASSCVVQMDPLAPASTVIACTSVPGTGGPSAPGTVFGISVVGGGAASNVVLPTDFGYAPPVITRFAGAGAAGANTLGGDTVLVFGTGFGSVAAAVVAQYSLAIAGPVPGVTAVLPNGTLLPGAVNYLPAPCAIVAADTQLACTTVPGAGAGLSWSVTVAGQPNTAPTTSYAAPAISALTVLSGSPTGPVVTGANTDGGDFLRVTGSGFGPTALTPTAQGSLRLIESVTIVSPAGVASQLSASAWNLTSDSSLTLAIGAGSGAGWRVAVRVAGVSSATSQATFSYAAPFVTSLACTPNGTAASTAGGGVCVVYGGNLALADASSSLAVLFGNPSDGSLGAAIPAAVVPRPDSDLTTPTRYLPGRVSFVVPAGMGAGRAVRLVAYRTGDPFPSAAAYTTAPLPTTTACAYSAATPLGCAGGVDAYSYAAPVLTSLVVTLPSTPAQIALATSQFGANAGATGSVRVIGLSGANFGASNAGAGFALVTRAIQWFDASVGAGVWRDLGYFAFAADQWTDTLVRGDREGSATGAPRAIPCSSFTPHRSRP